METERERERASERKKRKSKKPYHIGAVKKSKARKSAKSL